MLRALTALIDKIFGSVNALFSTSPAGAGDSPKRIDQEPRPAFDLGGRGSWTAPIVIAAGRLSAPEAPVLTVPLKPIALARNGAEERLAIFDRTKTI